MALTDSEKAKVRRYLGYPDGNRELHQTLEGAMVSLSTEGVTEVQEVLVDLASLDSSMRAGWSQQKVHRVEDVVFAADGGVRALRREASRLVNTLAAMLGVGVHRNIYGSGSCGGLMPRG